MSLHRERNKLDTILNKKIKDFENQKNQKIKDLEKKYHNEIEPLKKKLNEIDEEIVNQQAKKLLSKKSLEEKFQLLKNIVSKVDFNHLSDDEYFGRDLEQANLFIDELINDWDFQK